MRVYTFPEITALERRLRSRLTGTSRVDARWKTFPDGELFVSVRPARGHAVILGRTGPSGEDLLRTLLLLDAARRSGAGRATLVVPYLAYGRQDRQDEAGDSVAADLVLRAAALAGASRIVTADMHNPVLREASPVPVEDVSAVPTFAKAFSRIAGRKDVTVVAPDAGARDQAQELADALHLGRAAWCDKRRARDGKTRIAGMHGVLRGGNVILVDDIFSTGGTMRHAAMYLRKAGAREFRLCVTHPVFCDGALRNLRSLRCRDVVVSDSIPLSAAAARIPNIRVCSIADVLVEAVSSDG